MTPAEQPAPVSVLGLGMMGSALARAFLAQGHPTAVWNRSPEKADALAALGARVATSPEAAIAGDSAVFVCLSDYDAIRGLLDPLEPAGLSGRTLINLTSGTPEEARELAAWAGDHSVDYLDGAIMAIPQMVGEPETLLFYSGSSSVFESHEPTLKALGGNSVYLGPDPGVALLYDLGLLAMLWTSTAGYLHALALVGTAGVPPQDFLPFAQAWAEQLLVPDLSDTAQEVAGGDYTTDVSSIDVNKAAMDHLVRTSAAAGLSNQVMAPIKALFDRQVAEGHGALSLASTIELIKQPQSKCQ